MKTTPAPLPPTRTIPGMRHAPHADDCPAVGGDGGFFRLLAECHPKWTPRKGVCNCGRFYPEQETTP